MLLHFSAHKPTKLFHETSATEKILRVWWVFLVPSIKQCIMLIWSSYRMTIFISSWREAIRIPRKIHLKSFFLCILDILRCWLCKTPFERMEHPWLTLFTMCSNHVCKVNNDEIGLMLQRKKKINMVSGTFLSQQPFEAITNGMWTGCS